MAKLIEGAVRRVFSAWLCLFLLGAIAIAAQRGEGAGSGEAFVGVWSGTWEGSGGTGGLELTLERAKDGSIGGRVSVTGEPTYQTTIRTVSFDGAKMTAKYDLPSDESIAVVLEAKFDGDSATGTGAAREKANGGDVATGTWTVKKK